MSDHSDTQEAKIDYLPFNHVYTSLHGDSYPDEENDSVADAQDDTNPDSPNEGVSPDPPVWLLIRRKSAFRLRETRRGVWLTTSPQSSLELPFLDTEFVPTEGMGLSGEGFSGNSVLG
ncbi:hypothetical protein EVAR_97702_1 [Eumeta japonica]|uniref:Uncharacterized protein n=1 Tax=Eumeta variegata TaxID=151549 RepID=A0A4C2A9Q0_EUMVA|nr:hypothetical protein EVAR_97702_1 [Eumeta japonica]